MQPQGAHLLSLTSLGMCSKSAHWYTWRKNPYHLRLSAKGAANRAHTCMFQMIGSNIISSKECLVHIVKRLSKREGIIINQPKSMQAPAGYTSFRMQPQRTPVGTRKTKPNLTRAKEAQALRVLPTGRTPAVATPGW